MKNLCTLFLQLLSIISPPSSFSSGLFDVLEATAIKDTITIHTVSPGLGDLIQAQAFRATKTKLLNIKSLVKSHVNQAPRAKDFIGDGDTQRQNLAGV